MQKRLIVNADDFALHDCISQAILKAINHGIVRSVSCVVTTDYFSEAMNLIWDKKDISVGIHLNLTDGIPVSDKDAIAFLLDKKGFFLRSHAKVIAALSIRPHRLKNVCIELEGQIRKLKDVGVTISHLDSHGYIHMLPFLFPRIAHLAKKYGISFIRIPQERISFMRLTCCWKVLGLGILSCAARAYLRKQNMKYTDFFYGLADAGNMCEDAFIQLLPKIKVGLTEIVVHPGMNIDLLKTKFAWRYHWQEELNLLTGERLRKLISDNGISLANFNEAV